MVYILDDNGVTRNIETDNKVHVGRGARGHEAWRDEVRDP